MSFRITQCSLCLLASLLAFHARGDFFDDFQSYASDADVENVWQLLPSTNGGNNTASSSISLATNGANQYGHMSSIIGSSTRAQFRAQYVPTGSSNGTLSTIGDLSANAPILSISAVILGRQDLRDGADAGTGGYPFVQVGMVAADSSGILSQQTESLYAEISNDGTSVDINRRTSHITFTGSYAIGSAVAIPGGSFQSGDKLTLQFSATNMKLLYNDQVMIDSDISIDTSSGSPYEGGVGNSIVPYISTLRGVNTTTNAHAGDNELADFDDFRAEQLPEPSALAGLLFVAGVVGLRRRSR